MAGDDDIVAEFHRLVNMRADSLEKWLATDESKSVGIIRDDSSTGESVGHESGRHIVRILHAGRGKHSAADLAHMHKVVGYIKRHLAQRPHREDVDHTRWAYSLKNWGYDPAQDA